jgi:hypothetical protein
LIYLIIFYSKKINKITFLKSFFFSIKNGLSKASKLPPIQIVDGKVVDGAHRLSALSLLLSEDPSWGNFKLKVQEFKTEDWNKWKKETGQPADA